MKVVNVRLANTIAEPYIRHLFKAKGNASHALMCVLHNLYFYNKLMEDIRAAIENNEFYKFKDKMVEQFSQRARIN